MITMHESAVYEETDKPVICPKCTRGRLGHIPEDNEAVVSKRGKPPPNKKGSYIKVKCHVCRSLWKMTIE